MENIRNMNRLFRYLGNARSKLFLAAFFGVLGHVAAFLIPVLGVYSALTHHFLIWHMIACAVFRGIFRYIEQALNHDVAFRVLAQIRHTLFEALRKLIPGHFEMLGYGNVMTLMTSDIELLEVFYAHTISPILIALIFNGGVVIWLMVLHVSFGLIALMAYSVLGVALPLYFSNKGYTDGIKIRNKAASISSLTLESIFGFADLTQYMQWNSRIRRMNAMQHDLNRYHNRLNQINSANRFITDCCILGSLLCVLILGSVFKLELATVLLAGTIIVSSFGPVVALSNLSANLQHTFASASRVLKLLDTEPVMGPVLDGKNTVYQSLDIIDCECGYNGTVVLRDLNLSLGKTGIVGLKGSSGIGKTTLFNTIMQWTPKISGQILWSGDLIETINTQVLRKEIGAMEQETTLFKDTVANNIRIGRWDASTHEIMEAAEKASVHAFIMSLPKGYDTVISSDSVSSGERQRIGLARLFLHDGSLWLMDEPTSNLDSLNEAQILQTLESLKTIKSIVISSHRASTLSVAECTLDLDFLHQSKMKGL